MLDQAAPTLAPAASPAGSCEPAGPRAAPPIRAAEGARLFGLAAGALALTAALLAGWAPLGFSVATVFLFAGPHNWLEFRFFLARMPARWGRLRGFFLLALGGIFGLAAFHASLPWLAERGGWTGETYAYASAAWGTAFLLWLAALVHLRASERPGGDGSWAWPAALLLVAGVWLTPGLWEVGLVYLHPLVALFFLQRELRRKQPGWLPAYYACLALVPALLFLLWWKLGNGPSLPGTDALSLRITRHAGADFLRGVSSHFLVSAHTFLEMLHYGVWLVAIPLVSFRSAPWDVRPVPLFQRAEGWRWLVRGIVFGGAGLVVLLWGCFLADYPLTRDVYFTVAIVHVLAEFPFLLRTL